MGNLHVTSLSSAGMHHIKVSSVDLHFGFCPVLASQVKMLCLICRLMLRVLPPTPSIGCSPAMPTWYWTQVECIPLRLCPIAVYCSDSLALLIIVIICGLCPDCQYNQCLALLCITYITMYGLSASYLFVYTGAQPSSALLDCKLSTGLRMPEDLAAVAHGDATLNLDNFMHQVRV